MTKRNLPMTLCGTAAALLLLCFQAGQVYGWSSMAPNRTHQFILDQAYQQLTADPAYDPAAFPLLSLIQENEGVNWTGTGGFYGFDYMKGPGPDSEGASDYSEHYRNPVTNDGKGPDAVSQHWRYTVRGMQEGKKNVAAKAAAWSAHYLADMFVPFHVVGASRNTIRSLYEKLKSEGKADDVALTSDLFGSYKLCYLCPVKSMSRNFRTEVTRYVALGDQGPADWFDPWYYNGNSPSLPGVGNVIDPVKTSSHILWEGSVTNPSYDLKGYRTDWQNGDADPDIALVDKAAWARMFAAQAASETRDNLESYLQDAGPAVKKAIQSVATLWRSSFTALTPAVTLSVAGGFYKVNGVVRNKAAENASSVVFRLSTDGCRLAGGDQWQTAGTVAAGASSDRTLWLVDAHDGPCRLRMEVTGAYKATPDLQYAVREITVSPLRKTTVNIEGPSKMVAGSAVLFIARVSMPTVTGEAPATYVWTANGTTLDSPYDTQKATASSAGPYTVRVEVFQTIDGIRVKTGEAEQSFQVTAAPAQDRTPTPAVAMPPAPENKDCREILLKYENGQLAERRTVCKPHDYNEGLYVSWYQNGKKKEQAFYKNNLIDGDYTTWYENGILKGRIPNRNGVIHGKAETWWENGKIRWIENYFNGKRHGAAYYWDGNGQKTRDCQYENGALLHCKDYEAYRGEI